MKALRKPLARDEELPVEVCDGGETARMFGFEPVPTVGLILNPVESVENPALTRRCYISDWAPSAPERKMLVGGGRLRVTTYSPVPIPHHLRVVTSILGDQDDQEALCRIIADRLGKEVWTKHNKAVDLVAARRLAEVCMAALVDLFSS